MAFLETFEFQSLVQLLFGICFVVLCFLPSRFRLAWAFVFIVIGVLAWTIVGLHWALTFFFFIGALFVALWWQERNPIAIRKPAKNGAATKE